MDKVGEMNGEEGSQNSEITGSTASDEVNKWEQMAQEAGEFKDAEDSDYDESKRLDEYTRYLNDAVFEHVNLREVDRETDKYIEAVDVDRLIGLRREMVIEQERGVSQAGEYLAGLLEIKDKPIINIVQESEKTSSGLSLGAFSRAHGGKPRTIRLGIQGHDSSDEVLSTLAHEMWHAYQDDGIVRILNDDHPRTRDYLYLHNSAHYIRSDVDYIGYQLQLMEIEAELFAVKMSRVLAKAEKLEKWYQKKTYIDEHPEIYGDENEAGIEQEMHKVLDGINIDDFMQKAGVQKAEEFFEIETFEEKTPGFVKALSDLVELEEPVQVEFVDELADDYRVRFEYQERKIKVSRRRLRNVGMRTLAEAVWSFRERELARNENDEHSKLYAENLRPEHYIKRTEDEKLFENQLVIKERSRFADDLMSIIDEEALREEVSEMSFKEKLLTKIEISRTPNAFAYSKKYGVKRNGRKNRAIFGY